MSEKKLTPLQEAVKQIEKLAFENANSTDGIFVLALIKSHIINVLQPKEKEFARDMWDNSINYYASEYKMELDKGKNQLKPQPNFNDFYKQYEQS